MAAEGSEPRFMNKEEESSEEEEEEELTPEEQGAQTFMVVDKRTVPTNKILYTCRYQDRHSFSALTCIWKKIYVDIHMTGVGVTHYIKVINN